jgi:hypothetical protein
MKERGVAVIEELAVLVVRSKWINCICQVLSSPVVPSLVTRSKSL